MVLFPFEAGDHGRIAVEIEDDRSMEHALSQPEITEPEPVDPDLEHRLACIPEFGNWVLRVIINVKKTRLPEQTVHRATQANAPDAAPAPRCVPGESVTA